MYVNAFHITFFQLVFFLCAKMSISRLQIFLKSCADILFFILKEPKIAVNFPRYEN